MKKEPKIEILYEDSNILAINKPAHLAVHADARNNEYTLADWIVKRYPEMKEVGEPLETNGNLIYRPGIVHRLDTDTTGVLLLAKNQSSFKYLKRLFKERKIQKVYMAIVYGCLKDKRGIIDKPIGRSKFDFRMKSTGQSARGEEREAVTYYKVVEEFPEYSLVELRPKTGRTHQIRVHLKAISHPVACDSLYAKGAVCPTGMKRQALHALSVEFKLPGGDPIKVEAPLPSDFKTTLAKLRRL